MKMEEEKQKEMEMEMKARHDHEKESTTTSASTTTSTSSTGNKTVPFFKLFRFADVYDIGMMVIGSISAIANGMGMPLMAVLLGQLIHAFGTSDHSHVVPAVSKVALRFVYLAIGTGVGAFLQVSCWTITGERQAARVRILYLNTILRQDMAFFDTETTTGEVIGRMTGDTVLIQDAIGEKVGKFIQLLSTFFGGFVISFTEGWLLSLVMLSCIPALFIAGFVLSVYMTRMASKGQAAYVEAGIVVEQTIGAIRTVASFTGEQVAIERYNKSIRKAYLSTVQQAFVSGLGFGVCIFVIYSCYGLAIWYGAKLVIDKDYKGGQIISVIIAFTTGGTSLGQASPCFNSFAAGKAAAYKMFEVIKRKPLIDASDKNGIILEEIKGDIELKDVYFSYPARPDAQIFSGFSLHIPSGTTAALVGQSGSGKSTVINLVERFYDPEAGEVLIDGINLKKLQLKWIRETIGLVSQEPLLFATTIRENIMYGKEHATDEDIRTAIELGNAAKFIDKLPKGLETMVSEHGVQLSGGQKQRIAISRAILRNPKILLLDEATSALDVESEQIVQDALERIMLNRTTLVVAHRLTTIRNADIIAVVHQGKIVEQGTHSDLSMNPEGAYSQLIHLQKDAKEANVLEPWGPENVPSSFDTDKSLSTSRGSNGKVSSLTSGLPDSSTVHHEIKTRGDNSAEVEQDEEVHHKVPFRRLAYMNSPEIPVLLLGSIAAAIQGAITPVFAILLSTTVKIFYEPPNTLRKNSNFWALMYMALGGAALVSMPLQQYFFGVAGGKLIQRIRSMCFEKVIHQEISWFDDPANSSGAISARLSTDASTVRSVVGDALSLMVQNISTITAALIIAFIANWQLSLIVLILLPLMGLEGYAQVKFLQGFGADTKVMYEEASQVASDAVSGIRTVASFCSEQKVIALYQNKCKGPMKHGVRTGVVSGAGFGFAHFALYSTCALCFYAGARLAEDGKGSIGQVFRVFFALIISAMTVSQTSALAPDSSRAKHAAISILKILDRKPMTDSGSDLGITLDSVKGDIEFFKISFTYPTRPDVQILQDFCLSIPSGKTVALVGESGCGKSTIISLLERFYEPNSGNIYLDGVEIKKLKISWLRQQMGLVSQEPVLFNETIRTNIAYGKPGITSEEEIIAATKASNAYNFISALPQGFDTIVGERGMQMSGGQKQRIAIARAILKDPKILLLDEATSALDAESERVVQDAFDRIMINRTTIVVAHRLSTIKGADIIAVVKNGVIVEKGKHEELIRITDGTYASLVALHSNSAT